MSRELIIGTRGSKLALTQTNWVKSQLESHHEGLKISIKIIKTTGDRIQNVALDKIGDRGLFVKEIEEDLLNGCVDIAVHSLKDMPGVDTEGLKFVKSPVRADARDILIATTKVTSLEDLKEGAVVGTGSKRRAYQLKALRPDLNIEGIRGNVDTRLRKLDEGMYDAIVLAKAGLDRLGIEREHYLVLDPKWMLPAPAQGILGIQIRESDTEAEKLLGSLVHEESHLQATAERAFLRHIDGSCHMPIGAYATLDEGLLTLEGLFGNEDGSVMVRQTVSGDPSDAQALGKALADALKERMQTNES
ncbi:MULTISPECIES: hydroxymethylbilane synthase [unclassified Fusibacter]|uniref:hydroxymethylbilane synthase n=1 Tax=unclassified Fusibacter TaxID=2624464 RepID=UPI001012F965|nr:MULTISPECIES: hydroxymethylbilane synthase [unclassified Fusibacter]MCK8060520.1 hydroxymethylbilane synthase [Fusibacter sp. A2]NPE20191.1 hydroxymethylbilane synthase [Fusibacter sp. A1]RXV63401.1 hydroxymethylbilane synthase [Fusibacter sp. A1]